MKTQDDSEVYRLRWEAQEDFYCAPSCYPYCTLNSPLLRLKHVMYLKLIALIVILPFRSLALCGKSFHRDTIGFQEHKKMKLICFRCYKYFKSLISSDISALSNDVLAEFDSKEIKFWKASYRASKPSDEQSHQQRAFLRTALHVCGIEVKTDYIENEEVEEDETIRQTYYIEMVEEVRRN